ncbi:MAG: FAD-dependent oxidoreductase [Desulfovibrionaceae bacterium]
MAKTKTTRLAGMENGERVQSRILEGRIQEAVAAGARDIEIEAYGQHGLGGRLWVSKTEPLHVRITGSPGQRVGSMGFPGTSIEVDGPASDDTGWLNAGAEITVLGNASNGCCNAMAQGKVFIAGNIGARGMTMTKTNPRFEAPELWVLGGAGDYFAEFMAGGVAVICGVEPQDPTNVLGFRPCVGMVGGRIYVRGAYQGFSQADARLAEITDADWAWLTENLKGFLKRIGRGALLKTLSKRGEWQSIVALSPYEKAAKARRPMGQFHRQVWDAELGRGGMIGDLTDLDRSPIGLIVNGDLRRFVPVWENQKYLPPCQSSCPTGIPVQERWRLVREGKMDEAVDLALGYTPFPATVCGYLCPHLCMQKCTRTGGNLAPVDVSVLGRASRKARMPELPALSGRRVAVIGGGPAGLSMAWQLRLAGHEAVIYDTAAQLGGKLTAAIPGSRIPQDVLQQELERVREVLPHKRLDQAMTPEEFTALKGEYDYVVLAVGASKPRVLPVPGKEKLVPALTFLRAAKRGDAKPGKRVVIIGAGNVGCDVATEAYRFGAEQVQLIDIQKPAAFGKEKRDAEALGATFRWPCFTKEITDQGVVLSTGELIEADMVMVSIGDQPDLEFLPGDIATERGHIVVNDQWQTTDSKVFAIGDTVRPGLLTDAIGAGRKAAAVIAEIFAGRRPESDSRQPDMVPVHSETSEPIPYSRIKLEYFDPRVTSFDSVEGCAAQCSSCGVCRDCGVCEAICPESAISRIETAEGEVEMVSDPDKCIGCGFCAGACPCGIWTMTPNTPLA